MRGEVRGLKVGMRSAPVSGGTAQSGDNDQSPDFVISRGLFKVR
jgi:hypothetical protein